MNREPVQPLRENNNTSIASFLLDWCAAQCILGAILFWASY